MLKRVIRVEMNKLKKFLKNFWVPKLSYFDLCFVFSSSLLRLVAAFWLELFDSFDFVYCWLFTVGRLLLDGTGER